MEKVEDVWVGKFWSGVEVIVFLVEGGGEVFEGEVY